jgi:hypothetical protein
VSSLHQQTQQRSLSDEQPISGAFHLQNIEQDYLSIKSCASTQWSNAFCIPFARYIAGPATYFDTLSSAYYKDDVICLAFAAAVSFCSIQSQTVLLETLVSQAYIISQTKTRAWLLKRVLHMSYLYYGFTVDEKPTKVLPLNRCA